MAGDLPGASTETRGLFAHVLPQAVLDRPRAGMVPDITAPTRAGQPAPAAGAPPPPRRNVMMDVKTLSGAAGLYGLYREGPHARSNRRGAPVAERARKVHVDYVGRARALLQYPAVRGDCVGAFGECSRDLHSLLHDTVRSAAERHWREAGATSAL